MATFTVTTLVDENDYGAETVIGFEPSPIFPFAPIPITEPVGPDVSLREAIKLANERPGADTIVFADGVEGVIRLTNGEIAIIDALTIDGAGLITVTGDANDDDLTTTGDITDVAASGAGRLDDNSRIFDASAELTVDGLTLTGGRTTGTYDTGGAITSSQAVTILNSTVSGNSTAAFSAYGGGVYSRADVTVTNSTISGNSTGGTASLGGGVGSAGRVTVTNSAISDNATAGERAFGGGVFAITATVTNSTISGNSTAGDFANGGGLYTVGGLTVTGSTISGNGGTGSNVFGGGAYARGAVTVANSIVLGNTATASGAELFEYSGETGRGGLIAVTGVAIIGADADAFDVSQTTGSGVALNAQAAEVFAATMDNNGIFAGVLDDNGGPVETIALSADASNPALDATAIEGADARGQARGVDFQGVDNGGASDLGAFELQFGEDDAPPVITSTLSIVLGEGLSAALSQLPVTAEDLTTVAFSIAGGPDADAISIDAATGVLSLAEEPNFEAPTDANGDNMFEVIIRATDAGGSAASNTLTIVITDQNDAPVASDAAVSGDEGAAITGALTASDEDGDALSFSLVDGDGPFNGSVTITPEGAFTFTSVAGFSGTDSFSFQVSDGAQSDTGIATITVNPVDPVDPPTPTGPTNGDDTLIGTALNDTINALAGNDNVSGLAGDDLLIGGIGNDSIKGAAGDDRLRGNGGDDTLKGGGGGDNIKGNGGDDVIRGNGGADAIRAGGGGDNVKGGGGNDLIFGGGGADRLNGGGGADTLRGQGGDDTLKGNGGADVFQFRASDRNDTITDFRQGEDKIQIQSGANSFGALSLEQDGADVLIGFGAGQVRVVTDNVAAFDADDFIF